WSSDVCSSDLCRSVSMCFLPFRPRATGALIRGNLGQPQGERDIGGYADAARSHGVEDLDQHVTRRDEPLDRGGLAERLRQYRRAALRVLEKEIPAKMRATMERRRAPERQPMRKKPRRQPEARRDRA